MFGGTKQAVQEELARVQMTLLEGTFIEPSKLKIADYLDRWFVITMGLKPSPSGETLRFIYWMENYRSGAHSRLDIQYHFVWVTNYRKKVLTGAVGERVRDLIREVCRTNEIEIVQGAVSADHVHVLLSCPPTLSPSKIMQSIKGKTSRKLMMEFKHVQKQYWGRHFWARGYFVASSGNVTDEAIAEYIRGQDGTEPSDGDETFKVTPS